MSTSVYLTALAAADLGVMYFELFRVWFEVVDLVDPEVYFTSVYCGLANFSTGVTRDFSNWLIAFLTLERVVMVAAPYKAKDVCTVKNAKAATTILFILVCSPQLHWIVFSKPKKDGWWVCWEDETSAIASILAAVVEFVVGYIVVIVVFILNMILIILLYKSNYIPIETVRTTRVRVARGRRLTRTLLLIAVMFLVCETPRIIVSFICRFMERTNQRRIILNISFVISGINHGSNFFVYILASPRFRLLFLDMVPCRKTKSKSRDLENIAFSQLE